ncbi:hypothetical protein H0H93_005743 [Arthromyces matolae]|nr:hypothetical protein H0H93_005743 [Arthromyces matolae]
MSMSPWSAPKAKVQLRLSVQRLRTLQQKKEAQAKATRREIASVLERGKVETARIKVEALIHEDIHTELLELLELYCELLLARFGLLDQNTRLPDVGINESVCSIIHAAPRTELKELHILRDILMHKYGREFSLAVMENRDGCVSNRIIRKLDVATPSSELVDAYLHEIAKGYNISWSPPSTVADNDDSQGAQKDSDLHLETSQSVIEVKEADEDIKAESSMASGVNVEETKTQKSTVDKGAAVQPPPYTNSTDSSHNPASTSEPPGDDFDALMRRFAALKKP